MSAGTRFSFGPRDRRGLLAGLRTSQLVLLCGGALGAVVITRAGRASLPGAVGVLLCALMLGWLPVGGRSLDEWAPVIVGYLIGRRPPRRTRCGRTAPSRRRRVCAADGLELATVASATGTQIGVVVDRRWRAATAVMAVDGGGFALFDDAQRDRRVGAWAAALAGCAQGGSLLRLQWIERVEPTSGRCGAAELARPPSTSGLSAQQSYAALLQAERAQIAHRVVVAVTVRTDERGAGLTDADAAALFAELDGLERQLRQAGLATGGCLSAGELSRFVHRAGAALPNDLFGCGQPFPEVRRRGWSAVQVGTLWHAAYWVAEWPRQEVTSGFLLPLLLAGDARRSFSLVMAPVAQQRAVRSAEQARTARSADAELRQRHGFVLTARSRREDEAVLRREAELAAGHSAFRFSGYVTVSAADRAGLERAARRLEQTASAARLELVRLDGAHDVGFVCTLPTGRGCR